MMRFISSFLLLILVLSHSTLKSQSASTILIKGTVLAATDSTPIGYASVLLKQKDSLIKGYNLLADGRFSIQALPGKYKLEIFHVT
ncbi:MAG: hypothetical protein RLZZ42_718, partial [Bacteroidota bacterium]